MNQMRHFFERRWVSKIEDECATFEEAAQECDKNQELIKIRTGKMNKRCNPKHTMAAFTESSSSSARDIRALVFDCDGTVLDTMEFYWPTWQATCGKHGIPVTKRRFYELAGVPVKGIYQTLVADAVAADPNAACKGITSDDIDAILAEKKALVAARR